MSKNTQQLQVYIEAEDYRRLKLLGSNSRGMSKIVRALIKAHLARTRLPEVDPELLKLTETPDAT